MFQAPRQRRPARGGGGDQSGKGRSGVDAPNQRREVAFCRAARRPSRRALRVTRRWTGAIASSSAAVVSAASSSGKATRSFCPHCGTQLTFREDDYPDEIDVTTCSLDHPEAVPPRDHTHASAKLPWIALSDGLPRHPQARPSP